MDKMHFKTVFWTSSSLQYMHRIWDIDVPDTFIKLYVFCNELTLDRSRALSCRSSEGSVVRGFVRGSLVWSIMGCFQYKESRKEKKEEYLKNMPNLLTTQPKIFQLIFAWSKAWIRADLLGSPLASMTFAMSCSYSVPTLPVPPPAATVRW